MCSCVQCVSLAHNFLEMAYGCQDRFRWLRQNIGWEWVFSCQLIPCEFRVAWMMRCWTEWTSISKVREKLMRITEGRYWLFSSLIRYIFGSNRTWLGSWVFCFTPPYRCMAYGEGIRDGRLVSFSKQLKLISHEHRMLLRTVEHRISAAENGFQCNNNDTNHCCGAFS